MDINDEIIEDVIVEDEVEQDDIDVGDVTYVALTYNGGETDNIIVNVDNDNRIITATIKPIQYVSRETFPEAGSDRLLYVSTSDNVTWRWDGTLNNYVIVGKDYTTEIADIKDKIQQNTDEITRIDQEIVDISSEITDIQAKDVEQDLLLTAIEEANKDRDTKINALETKSAEHEQDLAANEKAIQANSDEIAKNAAAIEQNAKDIASNKTAIEKNAADIATNKAAIATLTDESGNSIEISVDPLTYILTLNLKNKAGTTISTGNVDLPLETMVVSASYKDGTLTLTLQNGQTVDIDISSIVDGLVNQQDFSDEVTRLDGEITTLQGEVTAHDLTITAIEEANKDRDTKINALETKINEHEQELADYENRIGDAELDIDNLMDQYNDLNEDVADNATNIATNTQDIANLKSTTEQHTTDIQDIKDNYATKQYVDENGGKIDSISVNGVPQPIDENKNVDLKIEAQEVSPATKDRLGTVRAWLENDFICFSTNPFDNYKFDSSVMVEGSTSVVQQNSMLVIS